MNYTPALIPRNTPAGSDLVSLNYAKLQFARFGRNCNFQNPPATSPYRVITISISH